MSMIAIDLEKPSRLVCLLDDGDLERILVAVKDEIKERQESDNWSL